MHASRHRARTGLAVVLAAVLHLAGCALTPTQRQSLDAYVGAMVQVEQSADLFLTDVADTDQVGEALRRIAGNPSGAPTTEYPAQFVPPPSDELADAGTPAQRAVAASRRALAAVHAYNAALTALAEGRSEAEVKNRVGAFATTLGAVAATVGQAIPGLGLLTEAAPRLLKLANDAANREQLVAVVDHGREPVNVILSALEQQTPSMYRLSVVQTSQAQQAVAEQIARSAIGLKTLLARHGPPANAALGESIAVAQAELGEIGRRTRTVGVVPVAFTYASGRPPFDAGAMAEAQMFVQSLRGSAQRYAELVAKQNAYHALLAAYVRALRETRHSLAQLHRSLSAPVDPLQQVPRLLDTAFALRSALAAYRHPATPAP